MVEGLIVAKANLLRELLSLEESVDCVRCILNAEQTAKLMIFTEKVSLNDVILLV